jgi:diaminohydroxyphosphoribosylaminopyrimidine deaminase/5-amino-6-(5-phosphoribosylamino)uracil reductase
VSLERALELAERGRGTTHPNPVVGCVIVDEETVVGEGWHERAGGPHAEVVALRHAGERARGATAYVTMEPCNHHGRTPPCSEALIEAGISRVVAGCRDPDPKAAGGLDRLRSAGVAVEVADGDLAFCCRRQNEAWRRWAVEGRPFVILKLAITLDGRVAVPGMRWVSGEASRRRVHELRAQVDAVAVGTGTVRADDPELTARGVGARSQPRRLAFGRGPLPAGSELKLLRGDPAEELRRLGAEGVQSLLLEGGPTIAAGFLRAGLVDKLLLFVAPRLAGGSGPVFRPEFARPLELRRLSAEPIGEDVLLTAYVHEP